ncbi:MAG: (deoxy)nucleoside triphosphate pyrophosphohydrolase [Pseudomonadales bacterium]|nr:(deoxy)nucleoside triphosphate pyrophosphohydrolase [Pseudomonadales bacterium]
MIEPESQSSYSALCVVAGVFTDGNRVLAMKRASVAISNPGVWEFPGGKIERDESPETALKRELQEECGIDAVVGEFLGESIFDDGHSAIQLLAYYIDAYEGELQLKDHDQMLWLQRSELASLDWAPADLPFVELLAKYASFV